METRPLTIEEQEIVNLLKHAVVYQDPENNTKDRNEIRDRIANHITKSIQEQYTTLDTKKYPRQDPLHMTALYQADRITRIIKAAGLNHTDSKMAHLINLALEETAWAVSYHHKRNKISDPQKAEQEAYTTVKIAEEVINKNCHPLETRAFRTALGKDPQPLKDTFETLKDIFRQEQYKQETIYSEKKFRKETPFLAFLREILEPLAKLIEGIVKAFKPQPIRSETFYEKDKVALFLSHDIHRAQKEDELRQEINKAMVEYIKGAISYMDPEKPEDKNAIFSVVYDYTKRSIEEQRQILSEKNYPQGDKLELIPVYQAEVITNLLKESNLDYRQPEHRKISQICIQATSAAVVSDHIDNNPNPTKENAERKALLTEKIMEEAINTDTTPISTKAYMDSLEKERIIDPIDYAYKIIKQAIVPKKVTMSQNLREKDRQEAHPFVVFLRSSLEPIGEKIQSIQDALYTKERRSEDYKRKMTMVQELYEGMTK